MQCSGFLFFPDGRGFGPLRAGWTVAGPRSQCRCQHRERPLVTALVRFGRTDERGVRMSTLWPAGQGAPASYLLCGRTWCLCSLKPNSCPQRRNLHVRISSDLELMNYLQQFELHSISIIFRSGLNRPLEIPLAFPDLATPRRSLQQALGFPPCSAGWGHSAGCGRGREGEPPLLAPGVPCWLGFRFGTRF